MNRRQAREEAFKILFEQQLNKQLIDMNKKTENTYLRNIVTGVLQNQDEIDERISSQLQNWTFDRIATIEKTILRISVFEILHMEDVPDAVSINEAVELAHKYGDDKSSKFINGILSKVN